MASPEAPQQDLTSILQTLSQFASRPTSQDHNESAQPSANQAAGHEDEDDAYEPPEPRQLSAFSVPGPRRPISASVPQAAESAARWSPHDAAGIIDWSAGLRHVTKLAASSDNLGRMVQRMVKNQRQNERDWWAGREALIQRQKDRVHDKAKLDDVLRSIGGLVSSNDGPDHATELLQYDKKVYRAQETMVKAMGAELGSIGVPFFGTHAKLVEDASKVSQSREQSASATISREEQRRLQIKIIKYLEDMYGS